MLCGKIFFPPEIFPFFYKVHQQLSISSLFFKHDKKMVEMEVLFEVKRKIDDKLFLVRVANKKIKSGAQKKG